MQLNDLIRKRCSIRNYSAKAVEPEKLDYVLEAARLAPSACNFQPWCFVVIQSAEAKAKIQACYPRDWFKSAPLYILVCSDHNQSWKRPSDSKDHADIDVSIAAEHICLAAVEQGLGTCWVCHFDVRQCAESFGLPLGVEATVIIPIGYPADPELFEQAKKKRKPAAEIIVTDYF
ncbi:MAG: nitroreductase family protein [Tannerella sp.]|jgi:nitroreductase|nr:nitroreductase family protein [Tannerella sp.]